MPVSLREEQGRSSIHSLAAPPSVLPVPPKQRPRPQSPARHPSCSTHTDRPPGHGAGQESPGGRSRGRHGGDQGTSSLPQPRLCWVPGLRSADATGLGSAGGGGPPASLHQRKAPPTHEEARPFTLSRLQPSFLIHAPRPCPASVICKNLKMAYFRQGRRLGMAVLKQEGRRCPVQPAPRLWPALLPSCSQPHGTGGLAAAGRKGCYL